MTGNIAVDTAIGLIFVYTLYSLLTTTIVEFISVNLQLRSKNLKRAVRRMLDDDDKPVLSDLFNKTPIIKYLSSGRFSRILGTNKYPSYMKSEVFSQGLVFLLKEESPTGLTTFDRLKESLQKYSHTETGSYLLFLLEESHGDLQKFTTSVEKWFDSTMDRSSGWYKKNIAFITVFVGFFIATVFNIDSIRIVNELSRDTKAREYYVQQASQILSNPNFTSATAIFDTTLSERLLNDNELYQKFNNDSARFVKFVYDSVYTQMVDVKSHLITRMDNMLTVSRKPRSIFSFRRPNAPVWWFYASWVNFLGCVITTIALSLGAPFWFDLLNKIVKLRSSLVVAGNSSPPEKGK